MGLVKAARLGVGLVVGTLLLSLTVAFAAGAGGTYPRGTHTGVARVDRVLDAVDSGKAARVADLIGAFKIACAARPGHSIPSRPQCKPGEQPGTRVEVFWAASCQPYFVRVEDAVNVISGWVSSPPQLYAIYRISDDVRHGTAVPRGGFGIVYAQKTQQGELLANELILGPRGGIRSFFYGCSQTPAWQLRHAPKGEVLLPPR
jgi:hypothetical protein